MTKSRTSRALRVFFAVMTAVSGVAQIATLWFGTLTEAAVVDSVIGAAYLIVAIGLFGQSRFSLFVAALLPGYMALALALSEPTDLERLRMASDTIISLGSVLLLWHSRHHPSA